jgi:hypothetical protein
VPPNCRRDRTAGGGRLTSGPCGRHLRGGRVPRQRARAQQYRPITQRVRRPANDGLTTLSLDGRITCQSTTDIEKQLQGRIR